MANAWSDPSHDGEYEKACDQNDPSVASSTSSRVSRLSVLVSGVTVSRSSSVAPGRGSNVRATS